MLRIETADKRQARRVWAHLDAAGFRATPPLPTLGLGKWSVIVERASRQEVFNALPPYLRQGVVFSTLGREGA